MAVFLPLCLSGLSAAPADYHILKLNPLKHITVDGSLTEWDTSYFLDSLRSGDNCFSWDVGWDWTTDKFNYLLYAAHDSGKVYFAMKTIHNYALVEGCPGSGCVDAYKINPGGQAMNFPIGFNGCILLNPSCPYTEGSTLFMRVDTTGSVGLPTAELSLAKSVIDPFGMGSFRLSVGFEENDDLSGCWKTIYGGIGVEYTGNKQDWNSNPWDNPAYYPTFHLVDSVEIEGKLEIGFYPGLSLRICPNPFNPATTIEYHIGSLEKGNLCIYDISGARLFFQEVHGQGRISWNAAGMASGTYLVRLSVGTKTLQKRILYLK